MLDLAELMRPWRALDRVPDLEPGDLLDEDRVLTRGAGTRQSRTPSG